MLRRFFFKVLLVAIAVFSFLAFSEVLFAQGRSSEAFERVKEVQERHTLKLMTKEGVEGTAVGMDENDQFVVKVYTARPGIGGISANLEGVPVQQVVSGKIYALVVDPTDRFDRPVPTGVSTGHPDITAGTIACRVKDAAGNVYALSNNHVYADENRASIGDNVLQPGTYDGGAEGANPLIVDGDEIGTLADYEPIIFGMWGLNIIDAAIASTTVDFVGTSTPLPPEGYGIPSSTTIAASASLNRAVQKYGRTTRLTTGTVASVNGAFLVRYSRGFAIFYNQITIEDPGFSDGGDSGSLIVTDDEFLNPVGLLFAVSDAMTIANPIGPVLTRFNVTIDDSEGGSGEPQSPVANAGTDQTVSDSDGDNEETVTLDGSASYAPDGTISSYLCEEGSTSLGSTPIITASFDVTGSPHTVTLTVTDNDGNIDTDTVVITVNPNQIPFADAGPDQTVSDDDDSGVEIVTLDGSASDDPDGTIQLYEWDINGDGIIDASGEIVDVIFSVGSHTVTLTVTDNGGETDTDYVNITVTEPSVGITVDSISPDMMPPGTTVVGVEISGSGFAAGADVTFENGRGPAPRADVTHVLDGIIEATVTTHKNAKPDIDWDVRVTNPDGSTGVLAGGFTVTP